MENISRVLNIKDQYILVYLKTINVWHYIKVFEIVKTWIFDNDKETDNKFVVCEQTNEILNLLVYDFWKTHIE